MSEQKLVPELRFPEFEGDWEDKTLGDITRIIDCKHRTPPYVEVGIPVVSPGSIRWGALDLESPVKRVSTKEYQSIMDHCDPKVGDLVFSRNQSLGIASYVSTGSPFVLGQDTVLIQSARDSGFIYYWLQRQNVQNYITSLSGGSTFSRINLSDIRQLNIKISTKDEQQKIADFLSFVDAKLAKLSRKKELLEDYKRGLMQQIFSQKLRFKRDDGSEFPEWQHITLGEVASIHKGAGLSKDALVDLGIHKCIHYGELFTKYNEYTECVLSRTNSNEGFKCEYGDIAMPTSDVTPKGLATATAILEGGVKAGGDINIIRLSAQFDPKFISYYINAHPNKIIPLVSGTTVKHIYAKDLKGIALVHPSKKEQQKISDFLSSFDQKIDVMAKQIEQLEAFKKGLLQKLFV